MAPHQRRSPPLSSGTGGTDEPAQAEAGEWWTPAQVDFARRSAASEVVGPMLNDFAADLNASNRSGGIVRISATAFRIDRPSPLSQHNGMVRVGFHLLSYPCATLGSWP